MNRNEILDACRDELYTAALSDALDGLGLHNQALAPGLAPVSDGMRMAGFARTGLYMPIWHDDETVDVYEHEIALVDDLKPGDVAMLACNGNLNITPWGELLSTRARYLGAAGCITDGCVRDVAIIREMAFPVFSAGRNPLDTKYRGKMMWADTPVSIGGVAVKSGDLVLADIDGIVVAPAEVMAEAVGRALEKVRAETTVRERLAGGASLARVFAESGIL